MRAFWFAFTMAATFVSPVSLSAQSATALQDMMNRLAPLPEARIYVAKQIITMDQVRPYAEAAAVVDGRIAAVGSRKDLEALSRQQDFVVDETFADKVLIAGLIDQHVHPWLASLTMVSKVISIEDWDTLGGLSPAVRDEAGYRERLLTALASHDPKDGTFVTWGYHHYFHGEMSRNYLNSVAPNFPVVIWHRSAHEFYINDRTAEAYGIDEQFYATFSKSAREQSDLKRGHFFEQGALKVLERLGPAVFTPERMLRGLEFAKTYFHRSGITTAAEPGGLVSKPLQDTANSVFGDENTPFNFYFIIDGKTLALEYLTEGPKKMLAEGERLLEWGEGRARFLPKQVKLLADGAIFSQLMKMREGYRDGHKGEWIMDPELFSSAFQVYWDAGYQIHVHQNGDAGLDLVIKNLERAQRRKPRFDHRTTIVHFGFAAPDQITELATLGAIVSANPYYATSLSERYAEIGIGPERVERMVPLADTLKAGISLSFHSDMPMACQASLPGLERRQPDRSFGPRGRSRTAHQRASGT